MKRCPQCRRDYYDESLLYCLDDGSALLDGPGSSEAATAIHSSTATENPTRHFDLSGSDKHPARAANRNSSIVGVIGILLVTILGVGSYLYYGRDGVKQIDSIAVMPFENQSGSADVEYLSDGMTESLINSLSKLPNLSVKARNTVFRYKGSEINEKKVGDELSVQALLFGRLTQRGDNLSIYMSLVDVQSGTVLWGENYDRRMQDLTVLQNDIVRDVSQKLRTRLSNADAKALTTNYTQNSEAYQHYLKGRHFWAKRSPEAIRKSIEYFNRAIEIDPSFARAYSGLADAYVVPSNRIPPHEGMPRAKAAALRALEIDETLAEAHTSLARVLQVYDWNWKEAEKEFKRAIELDPKYPIAHQWYGGWLERMGRIDLGIAERKVALELDPLSAITNFELGQAYLFSRDYDRALEQFNKTLELDPDFPAALQYLPLVYAHKGMYAEAIAQIEERPETRVIDITGTPGYVYAMAGRTREAREILEKLKQLREKEYITPVAIAYVYIGLGEKDEASAWLGKGYEDRAFQMQMLNVDPRWDSLREDPRFVGLMRRVGLPE